ncbi:MAG: hypothetical protein IKK49_01650 [Clostridia bacterium]|nr:hypothetical protein [Clostridia bacterium]
MAYIRDKREERTGYQAGDDFYNKLDLQCDFVMCYRLNESIEKRIGEYTEKGYVAHMMTGIAWGSYVDYIYEGKWDGRTHEDESQLDRYGNEIVHGYQTPYMVPTVSFADYLTENLKRVVDAGAVAIHVEEPEFWDRGGYSEAFKREYLLHYKQEWQPPHESLDNRYKCAKLKAYLYKRTIERVSCALKEYALTKYNRVLRFYVPTHSLLNYTQWKIMSPEGMLAQLPSVDGFIAQVWTGTSREPNCFEGKIKERTFETAYLEYSVMQELVKCTDKTMWFLHDPIEDNPIFDWNDYRYNYLKTVTASLLHPRINQYEICPWPNRVLTNKYPKDAPDAITIPPEYETLLNGVFQTLGDMECAEPDCDLQVGVLISDTALYQRDYPDNVLAPAAEEVGTVLREGEEELRAFENELFKGKGTREQQLKFIKSNAFPSFYGLSLPLLKYGMPVRSVLLDNTNRYTGYLDDCDVLVLSYEFMKPDYPNVNNAIATWVREGGTLIYVGDGSDPYHGINSWWTGKYSSPAEHLFKVLGIEPKNEKDVFTVGDGKVYTWKKNPAELCYSKQQADEYRALFNAAAAAKGYSWKEKNSIVQRRGTYVVAAVFDESVNDEPLTIEGKFADMFTERFELTDKKVIMPDENALLYDLSLIENETLRVIGTCVRVLEMSEADGKVSLKVHGGYDYDAYMRIRTPFEIKNARAKHADGTEVAVSFDYDSATRTVLLGFRSMAEDIFITLS